MTDTLSAGPGAPAGPPGGCGARPAEQSARDAAQSAQPDSMNGQRLMDGSEARRPEPSEPRRRPATPGEAALWYAVVLGWPVTPAVERGHEPSALPQAALVSAAQSAQTAEPADRSASALGPTPWHWAASSAPRLVEAVWQRCPGAPILAALGRAVPGADSLGAVDVPALVGAAALERLGRVPAAVGPVADGQGRIRFLVDLGPDHRGDGNFERWRDAGVDLRVCGPGEFCPLPTPGVRGPAAVVWAVPPDPDRAALPAAHLVTEVLDRAVRDAYPALWNAIAVD